MKKIMDDRGIPILGLFRNANGGVVVDDNKSLTKYYMEQKKSDEIVDLKSRLDQMETLIKQILEKNNA